MMMKLRLIAVAAATLAGLNSAHALAPADLAGAQKIYIAGASALRLSIGAHVQAICNSDLDVYFSKGNGSNVKDGDDHRAYACTLKDNTNGFPAGTKVVVHKRDAGGSSQGVANIAVQGTADARRFQAHLNVLDNGTCVRTANPSPVTDFQLPSYVCSTTSDQISHAGISDVEPALLQQSVNLSGAAVDVSVLNSKPFVQGIFGVIVNKSAYAALQAAQGLAPVDSPLLPNGTEAEKAARKAAFEANIPSLPSTFVRSAFTSGGGATGLASAQRGWNLVIPTTVDSKVVGKTVNVCRRNAGSGTQATLNAFFANNPCGSGSASSFVVQGVTGTIGVKGSSVAVASFGSAGGVETCVGETVENAVHADGKAYGVGYLSRENNPFANGGDKGYRYVKLDGVAPTRTNALTGIYPVVYDSTIQWNSVTVAASSEMEGFLNGVATAARPASLLQLDVDTQEGVMSPPSSYGARSTLSVAELGFASRVSRSPGNSCSVLRLTK